MLLADLVIASQRVAATSKRSEKVAEFAALLAACPAAEVEAAIGFLVGSPRQGRIGVGWSTLAGVDAEPAAVSALTITDVDRALTHIAAMQGEGSQRDRTEAVHALFGAATGDEQRHLRRVLTGEMRQGANEGVVTDAVARASGLPIASVRRAAMLMGDLGLAAVKALCGESLEAVGLTPLVGVQPMLAATSTSVAEAVGLTGPASVEWKLDGARIQVHRRGDEVRVFTRSLHEIAARVPHIVETVLALPADEFVLDGESLGLDEDGAPLKFQDSMNADTSLRPFFFDVLQAHGESLIDLPLRERKAVLRDVVPARLLLPTVDVGVDAGVDDVAAQQFADDAIAAGHEGVMVKALDSPYQAGRRGNTWRKVKPVHTLDLVVLAVEWGHGRRNGWLSNLHIGARGADGSFVMVGKTFKGMTDSILRWQTEHFQHIAIGTEGHVVHVRPETVVEIALDGVQRSTRYPGGVALRFARVRRYRDDKLPADADSIERVQSML